MNINDPQLLAAMARLNHNSDFIRVRDQYLSKLERDHTETCITAEHPAKAQGAVDAIRTILKDMKDSEEGYKRLTQNGEVPLP